MSEMKQLTEQIKGLKPLAVEVKETRELIAEVQQKTRLVVGSLKTDAKQQKADLDELLATLQMLDGNGEPETQGSGEEKPFRPEETQSAPDVAGSAPAEAGIAPVTN